MRKPWMLALGLSLLIVGATGLLLTFVFARPTALPICPGGGARSDDRVGAEASGVDAMFIEEMIPHHDDAIAMAELALERAEHEEIRELASDIIRTQTAENALMRGWYRDWIGTDAPEYSGRQGMMGRGMMGGMTDITRLEDAADFDRTFIEEMIPHHEMAVMMAQMAGANSRRPEMRELTRSIIRVQSEEIEKMQTWYREWYDR
ncbi:MAG: DUF305 domain-containing protein [Coriobacteriia bacterium]|nr:DUF305 domain-containing protein [Coriobacteriia bacterium]